MRPPRPEMSNTTPPPLNVPRKPAAPVRVAARLLSLGAVIGLASVVFRVLNQDTQLTYLRRTAGGVESGVPQSEIELVALVAFWGTIGLLVIVFLIQAILIGPLQRGKGWVRWVLLGLLVPNLLGLLLASAFLSDDTPGLQLTPLLLIAQVVLAVVAVLTMLLPAATRWFRQMRAESRG